MKRYNLSEVGAEIILRMIEDTIQPRIDSNGNFHKAIHTLPANFAGGRMINPSITDEGYLHMSGTNMMVKSSDFFIGTTEAGMFEFVIAGAQIRRESGA